MKTKVAQTMVAAIGDGVRTTVGGVVMFMLALEVGAVLATDGLHRLNSGGWIFYLMNGVVMVPSLLGVGWVGMLCDLFLGVCFVGLVWGEWPRMGTCSWVALVYAFGLLHLFHGMGMKGIPMSWANAVLLGLVVLGALGGVLRAVWTWRVWRRQEHRLLAELG